jgi:hypothetical protein
MTELSTIIISLIQKHFLFEQLSKSTPIAKTEEGGGGTDNQIRL